MKLTLQCVVRRRRGSRIRERSYLHNDAERLELSLRPSERTKYRPWRRGKAAASRTDRRYSLHPKATSIDEIGAKRRDDLQQTSWKGAFAHTKRLLEGDRLWVRDARGQHLQEPCHFYLPPLLAHPHRQGRRRHPCPYTRIARYPQPS